MTKQAIKEFYQEWQKKPENQGKSFTYGAVLCDLMRNYRNTGVDELDDALIEAAVNFYGITQNADYLDAAAAIAMLDISTICELAEYYIFNESESDEEAE